MAPLCVGVDESYSFDYRVGSRGLCSFEFDVRGLAAGFYVGTRVIMWRGGIGTTVSYGSCTSGDSVPHHVPVGPPVVGPGGYFITRVSSRFVVRPVVVVRPWGNFVSCIASVSVSVVVSLPSFVWVD